jgi:hypothetical protein
MSEVQSHGFGFEKWVRDRLFGGYEGSYMQKWDVPSDHNIYTPVPAHLHRLPVSIKTAKLGCPIGLGDVLRQRQIDHDFLMIVGFWEQRTPTEKWIVEIGCVSFSAASWNALWGQISLDEIQVIDRVVKNHGEHYSTVRSQAKQWKARPVVRSSTIVINPKIDSRTQRRIQCSLPFSAFWGHAGTRPTRQNAPTIWGLQFPNPIISSPRKFRSSNCSDPQFNPVAGQ